MDRSSGGGQPDHYVGGVDQTTERLFRRALEAAAKALRDLDADQVPADLRRVAGRPQPLPPPLAAALLKGIDRYEWLREKALEAWPEADPKTAGADQASALLLQRPPGWTAKVAGLVATLAAKEARGAEEDRGRQVEAARADAEEWRRRARAEKEAGRRSLREAEASLAEERAARRALQAAPARLDAAREAELAHWQAALGDRVIERDAAREEVRRLQEALAGERAARRALQAELAEASGSVHWAEDPVSLAGFLDWTASVARPPAVGSPGAQEGAASLRLPEGVRPDERAAVDWLVQRNEPATLIVDGYNAAFRLGAAGDAAAGRSRVLMVLERLHRVARGPLGIVVVFDSAAGVSLEETPPGSLEVRFAPEGSSADREIAELVAAMTGPRAVLSSDREVREAADQAGALALWSEALVEWERRR
jgi:predicted RNA-binding protein with PIN domain